MAHGGLCGHPYIEHGPFHPNLALAHSTPIPSQSTIQPLIIASSLPISVLWAPPTSTACLAHSSAECNAVPSGPFNGVAAPHRRNRTNNHPRPQGFTQAAPALAMSMLTPATSIVFCIHFLPYTVNYLLQIDLKYFSLHFIESIHSP